MKWIKKVAETPLDLIAKVIDSLSGNSKYNAPSIRAVNAGLATKADNNAVSAALAEKQDIITGGASTIVSANLTANKAVVTTAEGKVGASTVTAEELARLAGVTSNVQSQLNAKVNTIVIPNTYKIRAGTTVRNIESGIYTYNLFTNAQLNTMLGVSDVTNLNTFVGVLNGDFEAHNIRADNVAYIASTRSWSIHFDEATIGGAYRFNYIVVYFESGN